MNILGIDPGTLSLGYCILYQGPSILESGVLKLSKNECMQDRLNNIYHFLEGRILKYNVKIIAFETAFINKNPTVYLKLGYVRGILYLLAAQNRCCLKEYSPTEIKRAINGRGNSSKIEVSVALGKLFPQHRKQLQDAKQTDISDALAVGVTALWKK